MPPRYIGQYEVLEELGSGYFGTVYLAEGEVPGRGPSGPRHRQVAIKVLRDPGDADAFETLVQEFDLLDQVKHRSICKVYEFLEEQAAVVMERVEGVTFRTVLDECDRAGFPVMTEAAVEVGIELADCLYQAWATPSRRGEPLHLVHRDLKPENVMLTPEGEVKVLDFGLARVAAQGPDDAVMGTPLYMAPEQALGREVDHRTDLFAVGLILYELLMNRPAYQVPESGSDPVRTVMRRIERADLDDETRALENRLPGPGPIVARCLRAEPRARYSDGHELMLDLRRQLIKDRGAYLREFCEIFFGTIHPLEAPADSGGPHAGRGPSRPSGPDKRRAEPMSKKKKPPRPGGPPRPSGPRRPSGPPRPSKSGGGPRRPSGPAKGGAPSGPPKRPSGPPGGRPSGPPKGRPSGPPGRGPSGPPGRSAGPPPSGEEQGGDDEARKRRREELLESSARSPDETGMLRMMPLDEDADDDGSEKSKSATQFFAIPAAKKKKKPPSGGSGGGQIGGPGGSAPGGSMPPQGGGGALPGSAPPGGGGPGGGGGAMAISGPVAQGPTASGPAAQAGGTTGGSASQFQVASQPGAADGGADRARSYRVYAIVLGLFGLVFMAMTIAIVAVVIGMNQAEEEGDGVTEVEQPDPEPRPTEDTAVAPPPVAPPPPQPVSQPRPNPSPRPAPKPVATSAPATFVLPDGVRYMGVEVTCPSGFRERGAFSAGKATVSDVPTGEKCTAHFKGGMPAKAGGVHGGKTWNCTFPSSSAVCK